MGGKTTVWQMIREAVYDHGARSNTEVGRYIQGRWPGTNPSTVNTQIIYCSVNSPSRVHGPENQRVTIANRNIDLLFKTGRGTFEPYDSATQGQWEIVRDDAGRFKIHLRADGRDVSEFPPDAESVEIGSMEGPVAARAFAAEVHLRDYLAVNLQVIEDGLLPYADEFGNGHVEYRTPVGNIDILAVDRNGGLLIVELKVDRTSDAVAGQILRYVNWVRRHLANGRAVRGVIIGKAISDRLLYAIDADPTISAREYEMNLALHAPKEL